jgi:2'-5' RNA ligase
VAVEQGFLIFMCNNDNTIMYSVYQQMWQNAWPLITQNQIKHDVYLNGKIDTRRGITLLARIKPPGSNAISTFLSQMQQLEPQLYYYPQSDLHVTVLSILSCSAGYQLAIEEQSDYVELIQDAVNKTAAFKLEFKGITLADNAIVVCGYVADDTLAKLRAELRQHVSASDLAHSMDARYNLVTAHSTVARFRGDLQQPSAFADFLQANREYSFGSLHVSQLELVVNDWYQSKANTQVLAKMNLLKA